MDVNQALLLVNVEFADKPLFVHVVVVKLSVSSDGHDFVVVIVEQDDVGVDFGISLVEKSMLRCGLNLLNQNVP